MNIRIPWPVLGLAVLVAAVAAAAVLDIGPPKSSTRTSRELVTAESGVVQATVSGSGNVEPATDVAVNFQTTGVLQSIAVKVGQHVHKGQLLATLDPTAAQLTVDQARQSLTAAQDQLANAENVQSTASSSSSSATTTTATTAAVAHTTLVAHAAAAGAGAGSGAGHGGSGSAGSGGSSGAAGKSGSSGSGSGSSGSGSGSSGSGSGSSGSGSGSSGSGGSSAGSRGSSRSTGAAGRAGASASSGGSGSAGSGPTGSGASGGTAQSADTLAANVASAQAAVDGAEASLRNAENSLSETRLFAPATGTVVSIANVSPGQTVSGSAGSSGSGSGSGSGSSGGSGSGSAGSLAAASSSSSSSSGLIEIASTRHLTMTVAFSESDIGKVHVGQPATVTLDALSGVELPAKVTSISPIGSSSSGVVSYDATLTLHSSNRRVRPGMSASASVITAQATGVNLPSSAVPGTSGSVAHVEVMSGGTEAATPVVLGLVGDSRTQIVHGLHAGQQVVVTETLPSLGAAAASSSSPGSGGRGASGFPGGGLGGGIRRFLGGGRGGG